MCSCEFKVLENILSDYITHINNLKNNNTLTKLTLFLGCYSYDTSGLLPGTYEKYYFFVMNNLILNRKDFLLYDLKGSYINRTHINCRKCCSSSVYLLDEDFECDLKDNDYSDRVAIKLRKDSNTIQLYNILMEDSTFLMKHSLMDYSLLLAVKKQSDDKDSDNYNELVDTNGTIFSILIIDLFQKWDLNKKIENIYKIVYIIYFYILIVY